MNEQTVVEIVLSKEGVVSFSVLEGGQRNVFRDVAVLQLDVSPSGVRYSFNKLTEDGKKRADRAMAQMTGGVFGEDAPFGAPVETYRPGTYV